MINYPTKHIKAAKIVSSKGNMGMQLEKDVEISNKYYDDQKRGLILKRPTPIHVNRVSEINRTHILDARFEMKSTTDFYGIYRSKYLDFECKETSDIKQLNFTHIHAHQIEHLRKIRDYGGIGFLMIAFTSYQEVFLLDAPFFIGLYDAGIKSIKIDEIRRVGHLIEPGFLPRLDYLKTVDEVYFNEKSENSQEHSPLPC